MRFAESMWLFGVLAALGLGLVMALGGVRGERAVRRFGEVPVVTTLFTARPGGPSLLESPFRRVAATPVRRRDRR